MGWSGLGVGLGGVGLGLGGGGWGGGTWGMRVMQVEKDQTDQVITIIKGINR